MAAQPLVTIAIPTFNRASDVRGAIASALAQTEQSLEVLVVDNASTDGTEAVLAEFSARFPNRFRAIRNERNLWMQGNFTRCVMEARGKYLKIWCSDDRGHPTLVEKQVRVLEREPSVVACTVRRRRATPSVLFRFYDP